VVELLGAVEVGSFLGSPSDRNDPGAGSAEAVAGTRLYHGKVPSLGCTVRTGEPCMSVGLVPA